MVRHATLLGEWIGDEARGVIDFRKHVAWYLKGFAVGSEMRKKLAVTSSLEELGGQLHELDLDQPWPDGADGPRGRTSGNNRVVLPDGWLRTRTTARASAPTRSWTPPAAEAVREWLSPPRPVPPAAPAAPPPRCSSR